MELHAHVSGKPFCCITSKVGSIRYAPYIDLRVVSVENEPSSEFCGMAGLTPRQVLAIQEGRRFVTFEAGSAFYVSLVIEMIVP